MRTLGRTVLPALFVAFAAVFALFTSSSNSGAGSAVTNIDTSNKPVSKNSGGSGAITGSGSDPTTGFNSSGGNGGGTGASSGTGTSGGSSGTHHGPSTVESILRDLSIPGFDISTLGGRLQQYVIGLDLFFANPIFGIGALNFRYISDSYDFSHPVPIHNIYIALLAGTGLPGFLLYVSVLVMVLWSGWKAATAEKLREDRLLVVGVLAGIVGVLGFMFFDIKLIAHVPTMFPFWILAGAVIGTARRDTCADV